MSEPSARESELTGKSNGDPNFRQLEPDRQMAQACRCDTTSGLNEKLGTDAAIG
jgi:hypothetical protein